MPDTKITALTAIGANPIIPATFPIPMVDLTDTSMAASGTTKKVTVNQILGAGGTATLASATITGDLTVDTSTLKVDSANDRVGIGITAPGYNLHVGSAAYASVGTSIDSITQTSHIFKGTPDAVGYEYAKILSGRESSPFTYGSFLAFYTEGKNSGTTDTSTERYKIDSTGVATWSNVGGVAGTAMTLNSTGLGVGVVPSAKLDVQTSAGRFKVQNYGGASVKVSSSGALGYEVSAGNGHQFFIDTTQAMTLDASGNLLVGLTAALGGKIGAQVEGGNGAAYLLRHNGATAGKYRIFAIDGSNNGLFYDQNNVGMYMADAGTAWIATSDETQKDIIEPISNAISKVGSLRAVIGKFKTDANSVRRSFLIAQDVQTALPEAVHQKDGLLGLSYTDVIPLLVAAIKELTARVQTLETR